MLKVVIVGTGYVGLTTGVCLAYLGHKVVCVDSNPNVVCHLNKGDATIHEPGLQILLTKVKKNIQFTTSMELALTNTDVVIIAVGTPAKENGGSDVSAVEVVANQIGCIMNSEDTFVIVNKSTVPIGSARRVDTIIRAQLAKRNIKLSFHVASNPEFLREGNAIRDTLYPDRIIVGSEKIEAINILRKLYLPILEQTFIHPEEIIEPLGYNPPTFFTTDTTSAELIKYASNCFLAMKVSFINEFSVLAEKVGADIKDVAHGIGMDKRIGTQFLEAGLGWGGSCFGKDTKAMIYTASQYGCSMDMVKSAVKINNQQRMLIIEKLQSVIKVIRGHTIGVLGLAFKPNTDDLRDAPAIDIIESLLEAGARVRVYDPIAMDNFKRIFSYMDVEYCTNAVELSQGCDAILLVTEWPEFIGVDWKEISAQMCQKIIIDGRNLLNKRSMEELGFVYRGVGR